MSTVGFETQVEPDFQFLAGSRQRGWCQYVRGVPDYAKGGEGEKRGGGRLMPEEEEEE